MSAPDTAQPIPSPSTGPADPPPPTGSGKPQRLDEVATKLATLPGLPESRCKVLQAALSTAARRLGCKSTALPASPSQLLPMLRRPDDGGCPVLDQSSANNQSLVKGGARSRARRTRVAAIALPSRRLAGAVLEKLTTTRLTNGLSRFMHYASRAEVAPAAVDQAFLDGFVRDLEASGEEYPMFDGGTPTRFSCGTGVCGASMAGPRPNWRNR